MPSPRLTDVRGIAEYLGISEGAVYKAVQRQEIPVVRQGRRLRFDLRRIDRWIEQQAEEPARLAPVVLLAASAGWTGPAWAAVLLAAFLVISLVWATVSEVRR